MKMMKTLAPVLAIGCFATTSSVSFADTSGLTITPSVGYFQGDKDRAASGERIEDTFGSIGLGYRFSNPWQIELVYGKGELEDDTFESDYDSYRLDGLYHLSNGSVQPYLAFGAGYTEFSDVILPPATTVTTPDLEETNVNAGFGIKFLADKVFGLRADVRAIHDVDDEYLDVVSTLGFQFLIGGSNKEEVVEEVPAAPVEVDTDADGVLDGTDLCPATAAGIEVDVNGCEKDADADGVVNSKDECPDSEAGAKVDEKGCYIILSEEVSIRLDVKFANNSEEVPADYLENIGAVAQFMAQYPNTQVIIEGYTDDRGKAAYNLLLSEKRAKSVAAVLVSRYNINPSRVSSVGYGEAKPIADNDTATGRAENRRVVAVISTVVETRAE